MNAIFAQGIEERLLDVAAAVGLLLLAGMILVHLVWQPTKRLWIIQWSLVGGLVLTVGLVCPWHRFSLGIIRSNDIGTSVVGISTNSLSEGSLSIEPHAETAISESTARQRSERTDAAAIVDTNHTGIAGQKSSSAVRPSKSASALSVGETTRWLHWIVRGYLLGALGMLCWLAVGQSKVRRLIRRASLPAAELAQTWQELQKQTPSRVGSPRRPAMLLVSNDLAFPVAVGVLRPAVLLPRWLVESHGETQLRPVLVHELAHVGHHDAALRWLAAAFQIAFYYQPLFWFLRRQLHLCQEFLADAQAADSALSPSDYAEQLVALLKAAPAGFRRPLPVIGIIEGRSELYRRIQMIVTRPRRLEIKGNGRWKAIVSAALLVFAGSLGLVTLRAADPKQPDAAKAPDKAKTAEAQAPARPEFQVHVVDSQGKPVAGATVTPTGYSYQNVRAYGGNIDADDATPAVTDAKGLARIVFEVDEKHLQKKALKDLLKFGYSEVDLRVEHSEHPTMIAYFDPIGAGIVTLVDPETVEIRAHLAGEKAPLHHLYPVLKAPAVDWSEAADGVETIHRVDVRSEIPSRFLRIVHIPDDGRALFSEVYDLLLQKRPITIDAELKPGVRVEGRLADNVPRPIKNGRVVARIVEAETGWVNGSHWDAAADIAADGTFLFESLPPDADLQVTAICDGWVSKNPTDDEITEFWKRAYGNALDPRRFSMGIVFPQVFRLEGASIKATIPMARTASYEVTVLDENERPVPGARVGHWPNVLFYGSNNYLLGMGIDRLTRIRTQLDAGVHQEPVVDKEIADQHREFIARYERDTDVHGIAVIPNLPCGIDEGPAGGQDVSFWVHRDGYLVTANPPAADFPIEDQFSKVHLKPGDTSRVTVHMHKALEQTSLPAVADDELAGRVVDDQGKPIDDVQVLVWENDEDKIRTDKEGRFRHKVSTSNADEKHLLVRFKKSGYAPRLVVDWPLGLKDREIILENKTFFEGMVRRPDGKPAADVLIRANQGPKHENPAAVISEIWTETRTDADGHYKLLVQPDTYAIEIRAPGVGTARVPKDGEKGENAPADANLLPQPPRPKLAIGAREAKLLDIQLDPGVEFRAKILDSETGNPVPNVRLWHWQHPGIEGRSDKEGVVTIESMPAGEFTFIIEAPGYARGWSQDIPERWKKLMEESRRERASTLMIALDEGLSFDLRPGMPRATIELEPVVTITGHVLDPDGKPAAGATVAPARSGRGTSITGDTRFSVPTKDDGEFTVMLPPTDVSAYNLMVHDGKYQEWRKWANGVGPAIQTTPGKKIDNVELRLTRGGAISGRTVDEHGKPIANVYMQSTACDLMENNYYNPATRSDQDGRFELRFVRPGRNLVHGWILVPVPEKADDKTPIVEVKSGETASVGDVFIPPGMREHQ